MKEFTLQELKMSTDIIDLNKFGFQLMYPIFQQVRTKRTVVFELKSDLAKLRRELGKLVGVERHYTAKEIKQIHEHEKLVDDTIAATPNDFNQLDIISHDAVTSGQIYRADDFVYNVVSIEESRPAKGNHKLINGAPPLWYRVNVSKVGSVIVPRPVQESPTKTETDAATK